ncbi:MAG: hypothetical protein KGH71_04035 [Candidatus Micrarchaeota archaeon]|nr:hypothetical protein [Candidatus Micrarchaeota archaeon]
MALKNNGLRNSWNPEQKALAVALSEDYIMKLSTGNPGAVRVLVNLTRDFGPDFLEPLEKSRIRGGEIWLLFKDVCREDMDTFAKAVRDGSMVEKLGKCRYSSFYKEKRRV